MALLIIAASLVGAIAMPAMATTIEGGHEIKVVVIDPGHGAYGEGTSVKFNGKTYYEAELNLKISQYCRDYLEENYWNVNVLMTREDPAKVGLEERVQFAADNNADFLLSIHLNGLNGRLRGANALVPMGIYNPSQGAISRKAGTAILEELEKLGVRNRGFLEKTNYSQYPDGSRKDAYRIVRFGVEKNVPAIIMENCYIDNYQDFSAFLSSEPKLKKLGEANAKGLASVLELEDMSKKPPYYNSSAENGDTPFVDVYEVKHWFYDDVTYVYNSGLIKGTADNTFSPDMTTTRAMVVTLLYRIEGTEEKATTVSFTDVAADAWFYDAIEWAYLNDVTEGMGDGTFKPNQNVTREQLMTFLYRYAQRLNYPVETEQDLSAFWDAPTISDYAKSAVCWAVESGLLKGYEDGTIRPHRELSRSELAALMHRFAEYLLTVEPVEPVEPEEPEEPTEPEVTDPSEPEPTNPSEPDSTDPSEPESTDPSESDSLDPSEPDATDASEPSAQGDATA